MDATRAANAAIDWADAEGWNPGEDDAARFLAADPGAFLATEREGEVVATISCALYGDVFAFIGFFIVRADLRRGGLGHPLFTRALERAGDVWSGSTEFSSNRLRTSGAASYSPAATCAGAPPGEGSGRLG